MHGDRDTWRWWRNLVVRCCCLICLCIREKFVVVAGVVVGEVDSFHGVIVVLLNLRDYRHENLTVGAAGLLVVVFFWDRNALLEREFHVF